LMCREHGWVMMRGRDRENFPHYEKGKNKPVYKIYGRIEAVDVDGTERRCRQIQFSASGAKDVLLEIRTGAKVRFEVPDDIGDEFEESLNSEEKSVLYSAVTGRRSYRWLPKKQKPNNHFLDCTTMIVVALLSLGLYQPGLNGSNGT